MKSLLLLFAMTACLHVRSATMPPSAGVASWYGESHRGRLMANGKRFNPDRLTAASWFYPLGTRVRVTVDSPELNGRKQRPRTVVVTITDRGPAHRLVRDGRIIDLTYAAFCSLAHPNLGLIEVTVKPIDGPDEPALASKGSVPVKNRS